MRKLYCTSLLVFFASLLIFLGGCQEMFAQPGETEAEGHRRHLRNLRVNQRELVEDLDKIFLFDQPMQTTPMRIDSR